MRDGFLLHDKTLRMMNHMSDADGMLLIAYLWSYSKGNEVDWEKIQEVSPIVAVALEDACERMDSDIELYERQIKQKSEAGKKSAQKRWGGNGKVTESNEAVTESNGTVTESNGVITASNCEVTASNHSVSVSVLKEKDNTSYYPKRKEPLPLADCEALILNDGSEWKPTQDEFDEYKRLYPSVDIRQEFRSMRGWCSGNPTKRKTARGIKRFVTSWLSRSQDKPSRPSPNVKVEPRNYDMDDLERQLYAAQKG